MDFEQARPFLENNHRGVVTTFQRNGAAQSSIVVCGAYQGYMALVSVQGKSAKVRNLRRDPRCWITVLAYTPLANGALAFASDAHSGGRRQGLRGAANRLLGREREKQTLQEVASEVGKTPAQVALNWCISRPNVIAIPKSNSVARTEENCGASGWRLTEELIEYLDEAFPI